VPLRAARQLVVLASGKGKEAILCEVLNQASQSTPKLPLARVLHSHDNAVIFSDVAI
jgi:6-phosphogluconolactonase/glucosamine-6-phosphate isomerase/deaminase